ncbi:MAG: hypothetical protein WC455_10520 [Dehalococcoidia bacterium]|jgi:myo-inositol-hexaphosphate 3-phosphohydrolase
MDDNKYILNLSTNEFREMTDDEKSGQEFEGMIIDESDVAFMENEDIEAVIVYETEHWRGGTRKYIGIIHDGQLMVSSELTCRQWHSLSRLLFMHQDVK